MLLLITQQYIFAIPTSFQFLLFVVGIVLVGIPHGAADLLVANKIARQKSTAFSTAGFLVKYVLRLIAFAFFLYCFPLFGMLVFIILAAYHFGETDLSNFKTDTITGKIFVLSYGLLILGVIILPHFPEIRPLFERFELGTRYDAFFHFMNENRIELLSAIAGFFFVATFLYFSLNEKPAQKTDPFIIQLALLVLILFNLPLIIGFTLYFVCWHSILSINSIITYLKSDARLTEKTILKQIIFYSLLAIAGLALFGLTSSMFTSMDAMLVHILLGLAVLTAPHIQIMYEMYIEIRLIRTNQKEALQSQ
jgi:Brp/Blh family beta-carotene 15,15'-monooxygenase